MDHFRFFLGIGLAIVLVFAAASVYTHFVKTTRLSDTTDRETLYQVSTIDALMQGVYDGVLPVGELKKHGDFGIGTYEGLDGEMIVLDGIVYQAKADGYLYNASDEQIVPFATVTYFDNDHTTTTALPMNFSVFMSTMEHQLPTGNMIYAVRMHGTFPVMKVRAIPAQQKPYPVLTEASKTQSVHTFSNTTGTIVGFYTPVFFKGINVAGYHLHFISDDHTTGGHILDFLIPGNTTVEYDVTPGFAMGLPTSGDFTGVDLSQDLSADLAKVEK
jgi:acetolactate decarboxylase